jgi:tetratricopeptide (TPR) repeat protein
LQTQDLRQLGLELAELVMKTHPENAKAYQVYADFLVANNRKKEARDAYVTSLKYGKDNYKIWERIILFDHELGDIDNMLKHANEVVELFPNQGILWFYNGSANLLKQKYEEGVAALEQAKLFSTTNQELQFQILSRLGDAYHAVKDYPKSDRHYEKALELKPNDLIVLNNYSYYLALRKTKLEEAKKMSAKLLVAEPNNSTYLDTHGWVLFMAGEYANALAIFEKAAQHTQNATIIEHYGDTLYKTGKTDEALIQWKKAQSLGGEEPEKLERKINEKKLIE